MGKIDVTRIMQVLAERTTTFLAEESGVTVSGIEYEMNSIHRLELNHTTALLNVGGNINMYVGVSFEAPLIEKIFEGYAGDLDIAEDERDEGMEETAGDVVNIVVGNATADFADSGVLINLSPPVVLKEAKSITRKKAVNFYQAALTTDHGRMLVFCVGPKDLFDGKLNYI
ncbi:MAG: chemotaxis protein CheX [Desulfovibrionaceae bacterium]|nr:chemotaxis protein CheX [Desulfovibrionaceae bacterium]